MVHFNKKVNYLYLLNIGLVLLIFWIIGIRDWANTIFEEQLTYELSLTPLDWFIFLIMIFFVLYIIISREQTLMKLEESENKFRSLFDKSNDGVMLTNPNGEIISANKAASDILGWTEAEICELGRNGLVVKDLKLEKALKIRQETGNFSGELTFLHKSGKDVPVNLTSSIFTIGDKKEERTSLIFRDISREKLYQEGIKATLNERTFLLEEIHHRIKNNLAVVSGLLGLQIMNSPKSKEALIMSQNRIQSIAEVHELLYSSDSFSSISVSNYINKLADRVSNTFNEKKGLVNIITDVDDFYLGINQSVPFGLMVNELITNSFKHAFEGNLEPAISIKVKKEGNEIFFSYSDNGLGSKEVSTIDNFKNPNGLGLKLIETLTKQLSAYDIEMRGEEGYEYQFKFLKKLEIGTNLSMRVENK